MSIPENLRYSKDHEWASVEGTQVTIGITHYAQDSLGDVVFAELPEVGRELKKGEAFGVVESIKAVSDLYSPISGKVLEANKSLEDAPEKINQNPYGEAWIVKVESSNPSELEELMDSKAYGEFIANLT